MKNWTWKKMRASLFAAALLLFIAAAAQAASAATTQAPVAGKPRIGGAGSPIPIKFSEV